MVPTTALSRYGGWLPTNLKIRQAFFEERISLARNRMQKNTPHRKVIADFEKAIKDNETMHTLFKRIFLQVSPMNQIANLEELLNLMDDIIVSAPKFQVAPGAEGEPIGVPMYLLFDLLSNTDAGHVLFRMPSFNEELKKVLDDWGKYLKTNNSNNTLTKEIDGWFGELGLASLEAERRGDFNKTYVTPDPNAVNRGYSSWDSFFTREVQSSARPVEDAKDQSLIHSACESTVYRIACGVKAHDQFWLKAKSYSLYDMLSIDGDDSYVASFVGGTVYQAFLSPQDYHRWRSPVNGVIEKAVIIPGSYYAVLPDNGAPENDPDLPEHDPHGALIRSQAWLTIIAARALIFIRATNPDIGLMCFIGVGMAEVSTCTLSVEAGQPVSAGDELGMFHFGGSSHALVFGPQTKVTFHEHVVVNQHILVNSTIAEVFPAVGGA